MKPKKKSPRRPSVRRPPRKKQAAMVAADVAEEIDNDEEEERLADEAVAAMIVNWEEADKYAAEFRAIDGKVETLFADAKKGRRDALTLLHHLAKTAVKALGELDPEALRDLARKEYYWPVLMPRHLKAKNDPLRERLKNLDLGSLTPLDANKFLRTETLSHAIVENTVAVLLELRGPGSLSPPIPLGQTRQLLKRADLEISNQQRPFSFVQGDFTNHSGFISKLVLHKDGVSEILWGKLSESARKTLQDASATEQQQESALIQELNRILNGELIYDEHRFSKVRLSVAAKVRLKNRESDVPWLNRILLEDAYPRSIKAGIPSLPNVFALGNLTGDEESIEQWFVAIQTLVLQATKGEPTSDRFPKLREIGKYREKHAGAKPGSGTAEANIKEGFFERLKRMLRTIARQRPILSLTAGRCAAAIYAEGSDALANGNPLARV